MNIEFETWENDEGKDYGAEFIRNQGDDIATKIETALIETQKRPFMDLLRSEKVKKFSGEIYEVRLRIKTFNYRFFFVLRKNKAWIVEGFIKKTKKTPLKYIKNAEQRAKNIK